MPDLPTQPQPTSNQKPINWKNIIVGAVIGAVVIGLGVSVFLILQPEPETTSTDTAKKATSPAKVSTTSAKKDEMASWETYRDEKYGFEFKHPPNSTVRKTEGSDRQNIRLQNYTVIDDKQGLDSGEYYMEIFIYDPQKGHELTYSCTQEEIIDPKEVDLGIISGYRGQGVVFANTGGTLLVLCAERSDVDFSIHGTGSNENTTLVNSIFDSFKFFD